MAERELFQYLESTVQTHATSALPLVVDNDKLALWIIEDDQQFGRQLEELINMSTVFQCTRVFRACEPAVEVLKREDPPDLVLMDIGLPGMNGIDGIRSFHQIAPDIRIIMLTVFEDTNIIIRAISNGAAGYLLKGSSLETIVDSLRSILAGGAPINPQIAKRILDFFAQSTAPHPDYGLTPREKEVLSHLVDGLQKKQIADKMFVTFHTVDKHLRNIYAKLQVPSRSVAIAKALKENLL